MLCKDPDSKGAKAGVPGVLPSTREASVSVAAASILPGIGLATLWSSFAKLALVPTAWLRPGSGSGCGCDSRRDASDGGDGGDGDDGDRGRFCNLGCSRACSGPIILFVPVDFFTGLT